MLNVSIVHLIMFPLYRLGDPKTLKTLEDLGFLSDEPIAKMGSPLDSVDNSSSSSSFLPHIYQAHHPLHQQLSWPSSPPSDEPIVRMWSKMSHHKPALSLSLICLIFPLFSSILGPLNHQNKNIIIIFITSSSVYCDNIPWSDEHTSLWSSQLRQGGEGYDPYEARGDHHTSAQSCNKSNKATRCNDRSCSWMFFVPGDSQMAGQQKGAERNQLGEFLRSSAL